MRLNYNLIHSLAQYLEEMSRAEDSSFTRIINSLLYKTLADKLWSPFHFLCFSPVITLGIVLGVYLLFLILFSPLWLLSFLITSYGSALLFLLSFHYLTAFITRSIAFPGGNTSTLKSASSDLIRRLAQYIEHTCIATNSIASSFMLIGSGKLTPASAHLPESKYHLDQLAPAVDYLPVMRLHFKDALDSVKKDHSSSIGNSSVLSSEEMKNITQLIINLEDFVHAIQELMNFLHSNSSLLTSGMSSSRGKIAFQELVTLAGRCLTISEKLRVYASQLHPSSSKQGQGDDEEDSSGGGDSLLSKISKAFFSFTVGVQDYEKLAFPYLRSIMTRKYGAHPVFLKGCDGNVIDGILLTANFDQKRRQFEKRQQQLTGTASTTCDQIYTEDDHTAEEAIKGGVDNGKSIGSSKSSIVLSEHSSIVLFCNPNAAYYENISQYTNFNDSSWFGWYLSLGYDVFIYNYRGYGRSSGVPLPGALKKDGQVVIDYLQRQFQPSRLLIHGESIGGMIACHLAAYVTSQQQLQSASSSQQRMKVALLCDRTFASLDSTAVRILGGQNWTGWMMRNIGLWQTNVTMDYLLASCPKFILQDPNDEIIADGSSLKTGIASYLLTQDNTAIAWLPKEPLLYGIHRYSKLSLPYQEEAKAWMAMMDIGQQNLYHIHIPKAFLYHVFACCKHIADKSIEVQQKASNSSIGSHSGSGSGKGSSSTVINSIKNIELMQRQGGLHGNNDHSSSAAVAASTGKGGSGGEEALTTVLLEEDDVAEDNDGQDNQVDEDDEEEERKAADLENQQQAATLSSPAAFRNSKQRSLEDILAYRMDVDYISSSDISRPALSGYQRAWIAISRIDNGCGQYLGQAIAKAGLDGFLAWIYGYIIWGEGSCSEDDQQHDEQREGQLGQGQRGQRRVVMGYSNSSSSLQELKDNLAPSIVSSASSSSATATARGEGSASQSPSRRVVTMMHAVNDLRYLRQVYGSSSNTSSGEDLASEHAISFLIAAFKLLHERRTKWSQRPNQPSTPSAGSSPYDAMEAGQMATESGAGVGAAAQPGLLLQSCYQHLHETTAEHMLRCSTANEGYCTVTPTASGSDSSASAAAAAFTKANIGELHPLHCGHNGWPTPRDLQTLLDWLVKQEMITKEMRRNQQQQ